MNKYLLESRLFGIKLVTAVVLVVLCCFSSANAGDGKSLTEVEKQALIGTYRFKGDFKKAKDLVVELTISLDNAGQLIGHHRYKRKKTKGKWNYSVFTNYRRLSAREWTDEWKIKTLSGERCDQDLHCVVSDQQFFYWNKYTFKYKKRDKIRKRLSQFPQDYSEVQNYSMIKKGHGGGLSSPYKRVSESEGLNFVWCALEKTLARTIEGLCTLHKGKQFATRKQAETETNMKWKGGLPREEKTSAVQKSQDAEVELEFWKSIKDSDDPDMFQAYLDEYPNGKFVPLARLKIKKLLSSE